MSVERACEAVRAFFSKVLGKDCSIVGVRGQDDGWAVTVELVEESDYARRRGRDELVGVYEVRLDSDLQISGYERTGLRPRDATQ